MVESLSLWIKQIITVVIFTLFVDILMPSSNLQKYIKVVLGIVVMITILNPIISILKGDIVFTRTQLDVASYLDQDPIMIKTEEFKQKHFEMALELYKKKLENLIAQQVKNHTSLVVTKTDLKIDQNGKLEKIHLILKREDSSKSNKKVEKVSVKVDSPSSDISENLDEDLQGLKEYLSTFYEIPETNISLELEGNSWKMK
ncbi:MAG: stage III sporulation protein AF [Thermosediminibacteraceae bacterium]|nr:stage III sporulation protein AF [Thermosediminibacteraceae bacterium]